MATARSSHSASLLADGRVLVVGGYGADKDPVNTSEIYDPEAGSWSSAGTLAEPRADHTATVLSSGQVLVVGGLGEHTLTEIYDPVSGSWSASGDLNAPRYQHTAAALTDGTVMITGGLEGGQDGGRSNTSEIYDPETGTWLAVGPLPVEEEGQQP